MGLNGIIQIVSILVFIFTASAQSTGQCNGAKTCADCIKTHYTCKWCKDVDYSSPRCQSDVNQEIGDTCISWEFPVSDVQRDISPFDSIIQVQPNAIRITKLRPGEEKRMNVTVKSSRDYPLDVYYLMDFSFSMEDDLKQLKEVTLAITENLNQISRNFSLGFGTFVDKPTAPYANTEEGVMEKPCEGCQAVHSFNHEMPLTSGDEDAQNIFKTKLNGLNISSNIDNPEGGLDAMVQAAVCSQNIGWRNPSRRVIFYASDAVFHVAGDGKLAGIVQPNLGTCGMSNNKYTRSLNEDYPSLGQLNDILIKNKVIPIFAVTPDYKQLYEQLSNHLTQLSSVGKLSDDSSEVANLIKKQLESIIATTQLNPQGPADVSVDVIAKCDVGNQAPIESGQGCSGVSLEEDVNFEIVIKVPECVGDNPSYKFTIEVPGIATIPVELDMICKCACEDDQSTIDKNSDKCSGSGDLICGSCQCHSSTYGDHCQCNQTTEVSNDNCINPSNGYICGGDNNGKCICGQCECIQPNRNNYLRWGQYCECSNYECPRNNDNEICSNNGYCFCGVCDCTKTAGGTTKDPKDPKFTGDDCGCPVSTDTCIAPDKKEECSGPANGKCVCGECECAPDHFGQFCDICPDCGPLNCTLYTDCVNCVYNDEGGTCMEECRDTEGNKITTMLSTDDRVDTSKLGRHKQCSLAADDDCDIIFYLHYEDKGTSIQRELQQILIDRIPDCPTEPDIIAIVAGVIGGILGIGILLLILWRIFATILDKREYKKFLEERSKAKWNTGLSPLYKEPLTRYTNPLYTAAASR